MNEAHFHFPKPAVCLLQGFFTQGVVLLMDSVVCFKPVDVHECVVYISACYLLIKLDDYENMHVSKIRVLSVLCGFVLHN